MRHPHPHTLASLRMRLPRSPSTHAKRRSTTLSHQKPIPNPIEAPQHPMAVYVHWPWCTQICTFCNFNKYLKPSAQESDSLATKMKDAILSELAMTLTGADVADYLRYTPKRPLRRPSRDADESPTPVPLPTSTPLTIKSVYFGGGTPSLAPAHIVAGVLDLLSRMCRIATDVEVTVEGNPGTFPRAHLATLRAAGVNRISLGAQTFHDGTLAMLNRNHTVSDTLHTAEDVWSVFDMVEHPRPPSASSPRAPVLSVDMMTNLPRPQGGDVPSPTLEAELAAAAALRPHHMSVYELTLERGTKLWEEVERGTVDVDRGEDVRIRTWEAVAKHLGSHGYTRYEVSSYAKLPSGASLTSSSPYECGHNNWTWRGGDYIGVGPGAHGRVTVPTERDGAVRFRTYRTLDPAGWLRDVGTSGHGTRLVTPLSRATSVHELIVLGLRTSRGVSSDDVVAFVPTAGAHILADHLDLAAVRRCVEGGLLVVDEKDGGMTIRCTEKGLAVGDGLVGEIVK
ncbi:radical SAM enzyme [Gonapodya prolifera JEL478]|uniref:Radical SAM enzyme n=1 Tax=Gonapodya prolifera (strain JEL478) TaxID=1344416 RepID=A0A139A5C9_GONPJ|nr:radical SAM enzyme [Gonapodya prolifera JEL478]|eukprot:KXS12000.1 radical SAM enzyme [Gonapodya prolifera JEL478]